jgi:hypothetical protein
MSISRLAVHTYIYKYIYRYIRKNRQLSQAPIFKASRHFLFKSLYTDFPFVYTDFPFKRLLCTQIFRSCTQIFRSFYVNFLFIICIFSANL